VSDDTSYAFALLYLQEVEGKFRDREVLAQYFLPLPWYAERMARVDASLPALVARRAAARHDLKGRALGDRQAEDARRLAAGAARRALTERDVFFYFHDFDEDKRTFESMALVDRGLVYQLGEEPGAGLPDARFERRSAYEAGARPQTREERSVARRFSAASNRAGIARVRRGDLAGAETEFKQALAFDPRYAQAWLNLGLLAADYLEQIDLAANAWRTYLELAPTAPEAANVRARLAAIEAGETRSGVPTPP
jgi:tetratricopeptide (TPR) repeat protein